MQEWTNKHHLGIWHILISLNTKFHLEQIISHSWTQFAQRCFFGPKQKRQTSPPNLRHSIYKNVKLHVIQAIFNFLAKFVQKGEKHLFIVNVRCISKILSYPEIHLLKKQGDLFKKFVH